MTCARTLIRAVAAALLLSVLVVPDARADDQRAEAERFFRAGEQAYNAGQYEAAAQAFEEAYRLLPVAAIAFSTAQAYRLQYFLDRDARRLKRAIELYRVYVEQVPQGGRREDAVTSIAELEPLMARLEAQQLGPIESRPMTATTTQLMITSPVPNARAAIGELAGEVPLIREVTPGVHTVTVSADGYFPATQQATAVEGQFIVVELDLRPQPALVRVTTEAGARVAIDGRPRGTAPLAQALEVPAGRHLVTVTRRGRRPLSREIDIGRGEQVELAAPLRTTGQRRASRWVLIGSGATFAAAGVAGFLAYRAGSDAADLNDRRLSEGITSAELAEYHRLRDVRGDRLTATYVLLGVGAGVGVTGLLMHLFDHPRAEASPAAWGPEPAPAPASRLLGVTPTVGPGQGGVSLHGRF